MMASDFRIKRLKALRSTRLQILLGMATDPAKNKHQLESREELREFMRAIFYGFKPQRLEMPCWKGALSNEQILKLEEQGITPVFIDPTERNRKKHKLAKINLETRKKRLGV